MSSERSDSYYSIIESSFRRYYNGTYDVLYGVSMEASKAASSAWRTWITSSESSRPSLTTPVSLVRALNGGKSWSSGSSLASRSIGAFRDLTSFRFSRINTNVPQRSGTSPTSPIHHTKTAALNVVPTDPIQEADMDTWALSSTRRRLNKNEAVSLIAMGALYTLRDWALSEAFELLESLRFWLERWENPILSFMEAGPFVWFSRAGYHHGGLVGDKVATIQAHLSKLCVTIGELQQQIIQAGWKVGIIPYDTSPINEWLIMEDGGIECKEAESVRQCLLDIYPKVLESRRPLCYSSSDCIAAHAVEGASQTNDAALTEWTIHSMKLVRDHLTKIYDDRDSSMILHESANMFNDKDKDDLPSWADEWTKSYDVPSIYLNDQYVNDMTSLVNYMVVLRKRQVHRLDHLKPPSRLARNWYVLVVGAPLASYAVYQIVKEQMNSKLLPDIFNKISAFCEEHIFDPMRSIYRELFTRKGREDVTDRQARHHTMEILKKMIQSWVIDTYPNMSHDEVMDMVNQMDISLIEQKKEESIKNILELNNIIRMSMIEMQFIKKELMNALFSIDELMGSNEINVKLAAMTPAFLLFSSVRYVFRYLFYALLKLGRSKEQTYESLRMIVLDIERMLMLRDNEFHDDKVQMAEKLFLVPDDLGLFTLMIHECRQILRQSRRRFNTHDIKNIYEDLSELSGERGAITIRQQLQIVDRMTRTYSFLTAR